MTRWASLPISASGKHSDYRLYFLPLGSQPQKGLSYSWEHSKFFLCLSLKSLWVAVLSARPCQGWGCISHTHVALEHFWIDAHERKNSSQSIEWKLREQRIFWYCKECRGVCFSLPSFQFIYLFFIFENVCFFLFLFFFDAKRKDLPLL